ncbi:MAG: outer membrane beta-barrel protein [Burkholderiaceae bacterium]|nr:outer membrane beta-barrel protein [Burkholderiaceae bacterium]
MRNSRSGFARHLIPVALLATPLLASAQTELGTFALPSINDYGVSSLEIESGDRDVLLLNAGVEVTRHSNIFALPDGVSPRPIYGKSSRSDTVISGLFGVSFDRQVSLQRFRLDASVLPVKLVEYSEFDNIGYSAGAHWDWQVGRPWFGTLGARLTNALTPFGNYFANNKNTERRFKVYASGGVRLTPGWAAFVAVDRESLDNSFSGVEAADYRFVSAEAGARYAPGTATEIDFVLRHTNGDYPNRQVVDELGNLLPGAVDNGFSQNAVLARLQIRPSNDSRLFGEAGYTRRGFDHVSQRDFSGPTARLGLDWKPSGAFTMRTELFREIQSEELLTASYVDRTGIALRPSIQLTGKIVLHGLAVAARASYEGDPGLTGTSLAVRKDDLRIFGAGLSYEYARNVSVNLTARRTNRSSNFDAFEYDDNMFSMNVLARF